MPVLHRLYREAVTVSTDENACIRVTGRGLSPAGLRPLPPQEARAAADSLAARMQTLRSIRHFPNQDVRQDLPDRIVALAPWLATRGATVGYTRLYGLSAGRPTQERLDLVIAMGEALDSFTRP